MLIFCEECGEKYIIEGEDIKCEPILFNCRICNDIIRFSMPETLSKLVIDAENNGKLR
jgi:hypothetical protein